MDWLTDVLPKFVHLLLLPQVFAPIVSAAITAGALTLQSHLLSKREAQQETTRNQHAEKMAAAANDASFQRYRDEAHDQYKAEKTRTLEETAIKVLALVHERNQQIRIFRAKVSSQARLNDDELFPFFETETSARTLISQMSLLDEGLGRKCRYIYVTQFDAVGLLLTKKGLEKCRELCDKYEFATSDFISLTQRTIERMHPHASRHAEEALNGAKLEQPAEKP